jgi:hypothetical protein
VSAVLQHACGHPLAAALAAKAAGRRVVAYVGSAVPVELIHASGAFALQLVGDPVRATPLSDHYLDEEFDGEIRALFDLIGGGDANLADLVIIPRSANGLLYLYYSLLELRRMEPQRRFPELLLYDVLNTPSAATRRYVLGRTAALFTRLGGSEAQLRAAIFQANAVRRVLAALGARRRAGRLRGSTYWYALRASRLMAPDAWLAAAAALPDEAAPATRILLKGYGQDTPALYLHAEQLGANIVADDTPGGERSVSVLVDEGGTPLAALAVHYQLHVPTVRSYPRASEDAAWLTLFEDSAAQAALFYHEEFDDTLGWDYPAQQAQLDLRGMPYLLLARQAYRRPDYSALASLIERIAP